MVHVTEVGLRAASDQRLFENARSEGRILVTRNYPDFAALARAYAHRGRNFPGVLFLPHSVLQGDVGGHVRRIEEWVERHRDEGNPLRNTYGWL